MLRVAFTQPACGQQVCPSGVFKAIRQGFHLVPAARQPIAGARGIAPDGVAVRPELLDGSPNRPIRAMRPTHELVTGKGAPHLVGVLKKGQHGFSFDGEAHVWSRS